MTILPSLLLLLSSRAAAAARHEGAARSLAAGINVDSHAPSGRSSPTSLAAGNASSSSIIGLPGRRKRRTQAGAAATPGAGPHSHSSGRRKTQTQGAGIPGAGGYTGVSVLGPGGTFAEGDGGGLGPGAWVHQGPSGTIVVGNTQTNVESQVQLAFSGTPVGYRVPPNDRYDIVNYVGQQLQANLDHAFVLVDVADEGILSCSAGGGRQRKQRNLQWNNSGVNGSGAGIDWAANGVSPGSPGSNGNNNGQQNNAWNNQNGQQNAWNNQNGQQNAWNNNQNGGTNGSGAGTNWANNGAGGGSTGWNNQNGGGNGGAGAGGIGMYNQNANPGIRTGACMGNGPSIPIRITVQTSTNLVDSAYNYILQALQGNLNNILSYVKSMDRSGATAGLNLSFGWYDAANIVDSTAQPTPYPSPYPTPWPTPYPTPWPTPRPSRYPTPWPTPRPTPVRTSRPTFPRRTPRPTQVRTSRPTLPMPTAPDTDEEEQTIPMQFNLDDITPGYAPDAEDQEAIRQIIEDLISENLDPGLELGDVSYPTEVRRKRNLQDQDSEEEQNSLFLPMDITVKGPSGQIPMAFKDIMEIVEANKDELAKRLKEYDYDTFKDVGVSSEAKDFVDPITGAVMTNHPVQVFFKGVREGYELSEQDQESFISSIKDIMTMSVDSDWELIQVAYASRFMLDDTEVPHLPVRVTVSTPMEVSAKEALSRVLNILRGRKQDLLQELKSMDRNAFRDAMLSIESNDLPDITVPTFITEHAVSLLINNMGRAGYTFTSRIRSNIINFFKLLVLEHLPSVDNRLELIDITWAGKYRVLPSSPHIPMKVAVKGPSVASERTAEYIRDIAAEYNLKLTDYFSKLDDVFTDSTITVVPYSFDDVEMPEEENLAITWTPDGGEYFVEKFKESSHPIWLLLKNAKGYQFSAANQAAIVRFVKGLLEDNLDDLLELIEVSQAGSMKGQSLPLLINVKWPDDLSPDFALDNVFAALQDQEQEMGEFVQSLNQDELEDVGISFEMEDVGSSADSTTAPAGPGREVATHPVQLRFDSIPVGYHLSAADRASIIRLTNELLDDYLDESLDLKKVKYAGSGKPPTDDQAFLHSLPLHITVEEPEDQSDFNLSFIVDVLEGNMKEFVKHMKSLDWATFKDVEMTLDTKDSDEIIEYMLTTVNPVIMTCGGLPAGYSPSPDDKESIVGLTKDFLKESLGGSFQLDDIAEGTSSGRTRILISTSSQHTRRLADVAMPLDISVDGPPEKSDEAMAEIMTAFDEHSGDLEEALGELDEAFKDVKVSAEPSGKKAPTDMKRSVHPVELNMENLPAGYLLSRDIISSTRRFVTELLEENLDSIELVEVADAMRRRDRRLLSTRSKQARRLDAVSLPLSISVDAPADQSDEEVLSDILDALNDHDKDIERKLQSLDWDTFSEVDVWADTYDPDSIKTAHKVWMFIDDVSDGYRLSEDDRASILSFVQESLRENLDSDSVDLKEVVYAGNRNIRTLLSSRQLSSISEPLEISVMGSRDASDLAFSYVMEALSGIKNDIERHLKGIDWDAFKDAVVTFHTYDPNAKQMSETIHPVRLTLKNVSAGYHASQEALASILIFIQRLLDNYLDAIEVVDCSYAERSDSSLRGINRRLESVVLPLRITARGPIDESDFILSELMDVFREHEEEFMDNLQSMDPAFRDANLFTDLYDLSDTQETVQPVQMIFENVASDYRLSEDDQSSLLRFVEGGVGDSLGYSPFSLVDVSLVDGVLREGARSLQYRAPSLPLEFSVFGPVDLENFAMLDILKALRDNTRDIDSYLKSLDSDAFRNVRVYFEPYNVDDIRRPSEVMNEEEAKTPGWAWFLIVLFILLFLCCCIACCFGLYRHNKKEKIIEKDDPSTEEPVVRTIVPYKPDFEPEVVYRPAEIEYQPEVMSTNTDSSGSSDDSSEKMVVFVPPKGSSRTVHSAITHYADPPSEHNLKLTAQEQFLALPSPEEEPLYASETSYCVETVASGHSVLPGRGKANRSVRSSQSANRGNMLEPDYAHDFSNDAMVMYGENADQSRVGTEPGGVYHLENQSFATQSRSDAVREPGGMYYYEESSHAAPSYASRAAPSYASHAAPSYASQSEYAPQSQYGDISHGNNGDWDGVESFATQPPHTAQSQSAHMGFIEENSTFSAMQRPVSFRTADSVVLGPKTKKKKKKEKRRTTTSSRKNRSDHIIRTERSPSIGVDTPDDQSDDYYGQRQSFFV